MNSFIQMVLSSFEKIIPTRDHSCTSLFEKYFDAISSIFRKMPGGEYDNRKFLEILGDVHNLFVKDTSIFDTKFVINCVTMLIEQVEKDFSSSPKDNEEYKKTTSWNIYTLSKYIQFIQFGNLTAEEIKKQYNEIINTYIPNEKDKTQKQYWRALGKLLILLRLIVTAKYE